MIISFRHKGLENLFKKKETKGVRIEHVKKLRQILHVLNVASALEEIQSVPGLKCHALKGIRKNEHSVWVSGNWRVTFKFKDGDVYLANYEDYH